MTDVLIYGDTIRHPELRHEVPLTLGDPFLYAEKDGRSHIVDHRLRVAAPAGGRCRRRADLAVRPRPRRAARLREEVLADQARAHAARCPAHRPHRGDRAAHVSAAAGECPARERRRADARPRVLRPAPPRQERDGARGHPPRPARGRGGHERRARPLPPRRGVEERLAGRRRRAADVGAREARDPGRVHAPRLHGGGVHRLARRAVRDRSRHGLGHDPGRASRSSSISGRRTPRPRATPT